MSTIIFSLILFNLKLYFNLRVQNKVVLSCLVSILIFDEQYCYGNLHCVISVLSTLFVVVVIVVENYAIQLVTFFIITSVTSLPDNLLILQGD